MSRVEYVAVAVGRDEHQILYSKDGVEWWKVAAGDTFGTNGFGFGVAYSPVQNRWVAVGGGEHQILYSGNGMTWTNVTGDTFGTNGFGRGVAYSPVQNR